MACKTKQKQECQTAPSDRPLHVEATLRTVPAKSTSAWHATTDVYHQTNSSFYHNLLAMSNPPKNAGYSPAYHQHAPQVFNNAKVAAWLSDPTMPTARTVTPFTYETSGFRQLIDGIEDMMKQDIEKVVDPGMVISEW